MSFIDILQTDIDEMSLDELYKSFTQEIIALTREDQNYVSIIKDNLIKLHKEIIKREVADTVNNKEPKEQDF